MCYLQTDPCRLDTTDLLAKHRGQHPVVDAMRFLACALQTITWQYCRKAVTQSLRPARVRRVAGLPAELPPFA
jgi:hypothetical protein